MDYALKVENLKKTYKTTEAVKGISFDIKKGEIFALIGPNGAGKTTTLRMIATLLKPTDGEAFVNGESIHKNPLKVREAITYLPDEAGAYKTMTGDAYLEFMASLFAQNHEKKKEYIEMGREISGLKDRLKDKIGTYSKGMTRKLLISRAVMTNPVLAILDEPTNGLDIINALEIRETVKSLAKGGMSFLVSSHNMLEIEYVSDRVGIINKGMLLTTGTSEQLKNAYNANNLEEVFATVVKA